MSRGQGGSDHRVRVGAARSARTGTRILEAALRVFAEEGPDAPVIDDFVQAAGVARGTFYNHFKNVEELLEATSRWTTREAVEAIEVVVTKLESPSARLGVGLRLFLRHGAADPVWSRFVARVWTLGRLDLPLRDLDEALRLGEFEAPSAEVARCLLLGGVREALHRIGEGTVPAAFGDQFVETYLRALRADDARIAQVLSHPLTIP